MSEEINNQEPAATDAMQRSIEALERKNSELITELRAAKSKASKVPDGVNAQKDQRIESLEAKVRELELIAPAVTALAEIVHDPDLVLRSKLSADKIEREADGTVVVVDGYQRTPVAEWAKTLPSWMQKAPRPQGSGAPSAGSNAGQAPLGKNPFAAETFNLTEQSRLFRTDRDMYDRMKAAAQR